ncbi:MAG: response regulator [Paracoccaceae bacterium]
MTLVSPSSVRVAPLLPLLRRHARTLEGPRPAGNARVSTLPARSLGDPKATEARMDAGGDDRVALHAALEALEAPADAEPDGPHERPAAERRHDLAPTEQEALPPTALQGFSDAQAARIPGVAQPEVRGPVDSARSAPPALGASRIVIIEEEPIIAADLEAIVTDIGRSVVATSATRAAGVAAAPAHRPDRVPADIRPADGSSGIDAVRDVLAVLAVPAILVTAHAEGPPTGARPEPAFLAAKPFRADAVQAAAARAVLFRSSREMV